LRGIAARLAATAITPNQISVASIVFAAGGAAALLWLTPAWAALLLCVLGTQLRLLCNLFDGLVAVEGGKASAVGALYNEYPDRIADTVLIVALGYAAGHPWLGWLGALLAALTAYIRLSGGALGLPQSFRGPLAKQQRMAVLSAGCLAQIVETYFVSPGTRWSLLVAAAVIAAGSLLTCALRTRDIARLLRQQQGDRSGSTQR
jgi:phosphatidylglycerophosphate synthase